METEPPIDQEARSSTDGPLEMSKRFLVRPGPCLHIGKRNWSETFHLWVSGAFAVGSSRSREWARSALVGEDFRLVRQMR